MIKKSNWLLLTSPLLTFQILTPLATQKQVMQYEPWFPDQNIRSDWKNITYSNFISTHPAWQEYLNLTNNNNLDLRHKRNFIHLNSGNGHTYSHGYKTIAQINFKNYAPSKSSFIQNYKLNINFGLSYNSWTSDWGWSNPIYGSDGTNLRFSNRNFYSEINYDQEIKFDEYIEHGRKTHSQIFFALSWSGDWLSIKVKLESKTWWNWGSWVHHAAIISFKLSNITIVSKFSGDDFHYRLQKQFDAPFTLNTKTSPLIDSDDKTSVNGITKTNRQMVSEEIDKRLKSFFSHDYSEWIKRLSVEKQFVNHQNIVKLTFININSGLPSHIKKLFDNITLKVHVKFLPEFWQKSLKERLEIIPGKIVNPKNSENDLITDNPEFIKESGQEIYVYHNSVQLTFSSTKTSGEILVVNGQEVEVYNNIFKINLLDKGPEKEADNVYQISVKVQNSEKMKLTLKIATQSQDTTFRWLGWNPENNPHKPNEYNQYKLITSIINGQRNDEYDPTINPKTGLRNQMIFVNQPKNINRSSYPFPLNPLDKMGRLIKNKTDYIRGYIAEAMVANSGIKNIFDEEELKSIAKIERVQVEPKSFTDLIQTKETVDIKREMQFSTPGLWHYIYYIKDYVAKTINPKNTNYQVALAESGSTIHKFVYIGNQLQDYAEFLKQPVIFQNSKIEYFWSSIAGKHLKGFLKNERNITSTEQINALEYKEIIRYWKEYVSSAVREQIDRKEQFELFDLSTLKIETLRVNTNDKNELLQNIQSHLSNIIQKSSPESIYDIDYFVTNSLAQNLKQINFDNFLTITEDEKLKKIDLIVASTNQSLYVKGKTKFTIINDLKYDVKKILDLSTLKLQNFKYNFFKSEDKIKATFLNNYIFQYIKTTLNKHKPKNVTEEYVYGNDYHVQLTLPNQESLIIDIKNLKLTEDYLIANFLNKEVYQTLIITIIAKRDSYLLKNQISYEITNDPDSTIAPPDPKIIDKKDNQLIRSLMWIIPVAIAGATLLGFGTFFTIKRFKKKIK